MELYSLNLHKSIEYKSIPAATWASIYETGSALSDRDELLVVLNSENLVYTDENGPHATEPLPQPVAAGIRKAGTTVYPEERDTQAPHLLESAYLFVQSRYEEPHSVYTLLDWFIREAWWQREESEGSYYVRFVHEDGKTALQILRKKR